MSRTPSADDGRRSTSLGATRTERLEAFGWVHGRPAPMWLRGVATRRVLAVAAFLPLGMAVTSAFLPSGPVANVVGSVAPAVFLAVWALLSMATQWQAMVIWALDEREQHERRFAVELAYPLLIGMFFVLSTAAFVDIVTDARLLTPSEWVGMTATATASNVLLPAAVLAWRRPAADVGTA